MGDAHLALRTVEDEPPGGLGHGASEALGVAALAHLGHGREVLRRAFDVAVDEGLEVVEHPALGLLLEPAYHPQVDEADLEAVVGGEDEQVARVQVGVEEAVLIEHADDGSRAQVDDALALGIGQGLRALRTGAEPVEKRHRQHVF